MAESTALGFSLSVYAKGLPQESRKRYEEKLRLISCLDPFLLPDISVVARSNLPPVEASDILAYLVLQLALLQRNNSRLVRSEHYLMCNYPATAAHRYSRETLHHFSKLFSNS